MNVDQRISNLGPKQRALLSSWIDRKLPRRTPAGDKCLVAYIVPSDSSSGEDASSSVRAFLRERLPEYMVPSSVVALERLPLLPNGKLDRHALPSAEQARAETRKAFVAPRTELERHIAAAWKEVLGIEEVGIQDSFFELGGHSLLLVRLQGRLRRVLPVEPSVIDLFQYPTVSALAEELGRRAASAGRPMSSPQTLR
jgi:hypothetical protein